MTAPAPHIPPVSDSAAVRGPALQPEFPVLDTLRVVGALAVLITHTAFWAGAYTRNGAVGGLLARMDVGVTVFFVLSGFLLSRPWIARAAAGLPHPRTGRYLWKRFLRIFPLYVVTALLALTFVRANQDLGASDWMVTLLLGDIYVNERLPHGLTQMWSLATEVAFYLALPLLMLAGLGRRRRLRPVRMSALLVIMAGTTPLWITFLAQQVPGAEHRSVNEWLPSFGTWFAMGIGLALLHVLHSTGGLRTGVRRAVDTLGSVPGTCWTVALACMLVAATPVTGPTMFAAPSDAELLTKNLLYCVTGGVLVFTGVFADPTSSYARIMSFSWFRHLGHISYGIFCIHLPVLHLVMFLTDYELFGGHFFQIFGLTVVTTLLAAELLYRCVELPFMRLRSVGLPGRARVSAAQIEKSTR